MPERRTELATGLATTRERIATACRDAGRDPAGVTLVVVTKTYPASDVSLLVDLGVTDVGENRDQEASEKASSVAADGRTPHWHFIGRLQRNKCRSVVRYADTVQSVDSVRLVRALAKAAVAEGRIPDVLVQVSLDGDTARGGAVDGGDEAERDVWAVAREVAAADDALRLRGLMAVAPLGWEPARAFDLLAGLHTRFRGEFPQATVLSAGMSGDLEAAVAAGATHVRVGSAILGNRTPPAVT
ncbi:YggS family pyridoxal phosphate enzyme [Virgisporangium aliadipatigenens]|uniref:Pyridoxal phosphate homeostasis protein n=1 Tax=Virgisporangium aliadipatigenens TaxID=741659 RepID=A0A8J3YU53_9ACTN|nr:YggS family pyridoxal phosphate-dependent enzyme [Virgisporangium aliadipatigenens]GIJ49920.1 YggS family pyridoxal phosphate enzyme [Virgisporangium aliadipatigenens]